MEDGRSCGGWDLDLVAKYVTLTGPASCFSFGLQEGVLRAAASHAFPHVGSSVPYKALNNDFRLWALRDDYESSHSDSEESSESEWVAEDPEVLLRAPQACNSAEPYLRLDYTWTSKIPKLLAQYPYR